MSDNMKEAEDAVMNLFPLPSGYPEGDTEGREQKVRADVRKVLERLVEQQSAPAAEQVRQLKFDPREAGVIATDILNKCPFTILRQAHDWLWTAMVDALSAQEKSVEASEHVKELVFMALGEASMCWEPIPVGVFDSTRAKDVGDRLLAALAAASPSEDTKADADADLVAMTVGYFLARENPDKFRALAEQARDAAMSSPSVTQTETSATPATSAAGETTAQIHVEHYFPKGYDPKGEPWQSISKHVAALREQPGPVQDTFSRIRKTAVEACGFDDEGAPCEVIVRRAFAFLQGQLATAQKEASEAQAALKQIIEQVKPWQEDGKLMHGTHVESNVYRIALCATNNGCSALNAVIEAEIVKRFKAISEALLNDVTSSSDRATPGAQGPSA